MTTQAHQRPPEQLAKELWFYSLERRAQTVVLRRTTIALSVAAVLFIFAAAMQPLATAGALGLVAAVGTLETAIFVRAEAQKKSVLAQLRAGGNPQRVDAVGQRFANRAVLFVALGVAIVVAAISILVINQLA